MNARALVTALILAVAAVGCQPTPTPAPTATATLTPAPSPTATPASESERVTLEMDGVMKTFMDQGDVSACSAAVVRPGDEEDALETQIFNYGTLSHESDTPVDSDTQYEIGSLSKLFTATVLAVLVDEEVVLFEDHLQKFLPEEVVVPTRFDNHITLAHLATNASGLPRRAQTIHGIRRVDGKRLMGYATDEEVFEFLSLFHLKTAPGAKWEYSNVGFGLLGIAEEQALGTDYESLVIGRVASPLGMRHTRVKLNADETKHAAQGYNLSGDEAPPFATETALLGAGGLRSTIADLAIYVAANISPPDTPLGDSMALAQQSFTSGPNPDMRQGLGWEIANVDTPDVMLVKAGETAGFSSYIAVAPQQRVGYVVVCNRPGVIKIVPALNALIGQPDAPIDEYEDTP